jgi:hypothetical protein
MEGRHLEWDGNPCSPISNRGMREGRPRTRRTRDPLPGPGEVGVRLMTSGVNLSDWKAGIGGFRPMPAPHLGRDPGAGHDRGRRIWFYGEARAERNSRGRRLCHLGLICGRALCSIVFRRFIHLNYFFRGPRPDHRYSCEVPRHHYGLGDGVLWDVTLRHPALARLNQML